MCFWFLLLNDNESASASIYWCLENCCCCGFQFVPSSQVTRENLTTYFCTSWELQWRRWIVSSSLLHIYCSIVTFVTDNEYLSVPDYMCKSTQSHHSLQNFLSPRSKEALLYIFWNQWLEPMDIHTKGGRQFLPLPTAEICPTLSLFLGICWPLRRKRGLHQKRGARMDGNLFYLQISSKGSNPFLSKLASNDLEGWGK